LGERFEVSEEGRRFVVEGGGSGKARGGGGGIRWRGEMRREWSRREGGKKGDGWVEREWVCAREEGRE